MNATYYRCNTCLFYIIDMISRFEMIYKYGTSLKLDEILQIWISFNLYWSGNIDNGIKKEKKKAYTLAN